MRTAIGMAWVVAAVSIGGCSDEAGESEELSTTLSGTSTTSVAPVPIEDRIVQVQASQVDVLWVIDDSSSMLDEQSKLTESFDYFMNYFLDSGLDYHIGVISTDMDAPGKSGTLQSAGPYDFIDADTPAPSQMFETMATLGTNGSDEEKGLHAAYAALETKGNNGFYRPDAALHIVVLSDEDDQTSDADISLDEFISWYDGLKAEPGQRTFSAIVHTEAPVPPQEERGARYLSVADDIGGIGYNIQDESYDVVLDQLGAQAAGLTREFFLSKLPVPTTIEVAVHDGDAVMEQEWTYDATHNSITFVSFVPEALMEVVINYDELVSP